MRAAGVKNVDAFIAYQKGLKLYADAHDPAHSRNVMEGLRLANKEFDKAIALEPGFSQAYFAAADLYDHILLADDRPRPNASMRNARPCTITGWRPPTVTTSSNASSRSPIDS